MLHLAATLDGTLLRDSSEEKLPGDGPENRRRLNLRKTTRDLPLISGLVLVVVAVISQPGLASYAAGNAFLDALAISPAQKLVASVESGPWTSIGAPRRRP